MNTNSLNIRIFLILFISTISICSQSSARATLSVIDSLLLVLENAPSEEKAVANFEVGLSYTRMGKMGTALPFLTAALDLSKSEGNIELQLDILEALAYAYNSRGESEKSLSYFFQGLEISDAQSLKKKRADFLFFIGDYFRLAHHVDSAIDYLTQAEEIYEELGLFKELCSKVLYTKASTYKVSNKEGDPEKGIAIYKDMLAGKCLSTFDSLKIGKIYNNLGSTLAFTGKFSEAKKYLDKAIKIKNKFGGPITNAFTYNELSSLYFLQNDYGKALRYSHLAKEHALQGQNIHLLYDIYENITFSNRALGNHKEALEYMTKSYKLKDSLASSERISAIADMELKYDSERKETELANQKLKLAKQESRNQLLLLLGFILLSFLAAAFFWYRFVLKQKKKEAKQLESLANLKTRYFTNISHELRTPLSLIIDPISRVKPNVKNPADLALLDIAERNAKNMLHLVNQMMDLSKLEAGKMTLNLSNGDLVNVIEATADNFKSHAKSKLISLTTSSEISQIQINFDKHKLEKIMNNLLSNALKFTEAGGDVSVLVLSRNEHVEIIVKDTGIGIPENQLPHVFDRFFQMDDSNTRNYEGTGIGLSLVKELVELHQGSISLKSALGEGTTVFIKIPSTLEIVSKEESNGEQLSFNPASPMVKLGDKKSSLAISSKAAYLQGKEQEDEPIILIIEDNKTLRTYLADLLSPNYIVHQASNGLDGIRLAKELIPDLIISDIMMPEMDGYEVCKVLKQEELTSHIPIILLTAKSTLEEKLEGLKNQADDYITKPFDSQEILVRVNNLIAQRKLLKAKFNNGLQLSPTNISENSMDQKFMSRIMEALESNLKDESFGVEALSREVGLSRSQLHRKIKALTGKSTNLFIRKIRLQRAMQLLEQNAGTASEIAFEVGFSNPSYFFKCFKEEFGVTPGKVLVRSK